MSSDHLDAEFVARQKERLEQQQDELARIQEGMHGDELNRSEEQADTTLDSGDMSQEMFDREMDATVGEQAEQRLGAIGRALEKIQEGTYGLSDESGEQIPQGRLEAVPEATRTVDEQERYEKERRPPL